MRAYRPPTPDEPHAILKVRRTYEQTAGADLSEELTLDGYPAFSTTVGAGAAATARSDAILVHPAPVDLGFRASFSHQESRQTVDDGTCKQTLRFSPKQGSSYLVQYTYQEPNVCALSCFEQKPSVDGSLAQTPCAP